MSRHPSPSRRRPTYANVVSTLALVVAVGTGGAYAADRIAKNSVGSNAVKNKSLRYKDLAQRTIEKLDTTERAAVADDGRLVSGTARSAELVAGNANYYKVTFRRNISDCAYTATAREGGIAGGPVTAKLTGGDGRDLFVSTHNASGPVAANFYVIVDC